MKVSIQQDPFPVNTTYIFLFQQETKQHNLCFITKRSHYYTKFTYFVTPDTFHVITYQLSSLRNISCFDKLVSYNKTLTCR